jgi:hypothetical protein
MHPVCIILIHVSQQYKKYCVLHNNAFMANLSSAKIKRVYPIFLSDFNKSLKTSRKIFIKYHWNPSSGNRFDIC